MHYLLGRDENSVENPVNEFSHAWDTVFETMDARARAGGLWKLVVPTGPLRKSMAVLNGVAFRHIDRAIQRRINGEKLGNSFLDSITEETLDREVGLLNHIHGSTEIDPFFKEIRGHLMTIILGGRDTAALTLT